MRASYVSNALVDGETVLWRAHYHWLTWVMPVLSLAVPAALWLLTFFYFSPETRAFMHYVMLIVTGLGLLYFLWEVIRLRSTEIAVTNRRFIRKTGWISRDTSEISLRNIEEVKLDQSIWGRILGYGAITVRGTGGSAVSSPLIDNPKQLQKQLQMAISAAQPPRGDTAKS